MDILINGSEIDFEIENEKNLLDVLKSVENWGNKSHLILTSFRVNESQSEYLLREAFRQINIDDVKKLELQMCSEKEHVYQSAKGLKDFLTRFRSQVEVSADSMEVTETLSAIDWIEENVNKFLAIFSFINQDAILTAVKEIKITLYKRKKEITIDMIADKLKLIEKFVDRLIFKAQIYFIGDMLAICNEAALPSLKSQMQTLIVELIDKLPLVAEKIQTGHDGEAMNLLEDVTEAYEVLTHYLEKGKMTETLVNGIRGSYLLREIREVLTLIENNLKAEDLIEVSDLIEYEFGEKLIGLKEFMNEFMKVS